MENSINLRIPRMARSLEKADWELYKKSQEPHRKAWEKMIAEWEEQYHFGRTSESRRSAGENLGYSKIRIATHEFFRPLYWFNGKLFC